MTFLYLCTPKLGIKRTCNYSILSKQLIITAKLAAKSIFFAVGLFYT